MLAASANWWCTKNSGRWLSTCLTFAGIPSGEKFSLTDQLRRASRSIGGQIAEAWAKRRYEKHFIAKLTDADAEQQETQHWILSAHDSGYLSREDAKRLLQSCAEIGRMLQGMIDSATAFCQDATSSKVREESAQYFQSATTEDVDDRSLITDY